MQQHRTCNPTLPAACRPAPFEMIHNTEYAVGLDSPPLFASTNPS
jgi:hypothetical protein